MAGRLQPPPNPTLGKRKSEDDLGKVAAKERWTAKDAEANKRGHWERKEIRQRKPAYYCCQCGKERGLDKKGRCIICRHGPKACLDCLILRSK